MPQALKIASLASSGDSEVDADPLIHLDQAERAAASRKRYTLFRRTAFGESSRTGSKRARITWIQHQVVMSTLQQRVSEFRDETRTATCRCGQLSCTPKTAVTESSATNKEEYSCQCCHPVVYATPQGEEDYKVKGVEEQNNLATFISCSPQMEGIWNQDQPNICCFR